MRGLTHHHVPPIAKAFHWMPAGEIYIKLVVGFPNDPKVRALSRFGSPDAGLARDLYVQMILHCQAERTDGIVSADQVGLLVYPLALEHGNQLAKQLASVGLIREVPDGWEVCAFLKRNRSREQVEELSKVRAESGRTGGRKSRKPPAQKRSQSAGKQLANQSAYQVGNQIDKQNVSKPVSVSAYADTDTSQTPTVSAASGLTITQRSKRITDAYAQAEPMCKWPAVNGVVIRAIKAERWSDDEILAALLRMAKDNRSVTIDALRTELDGLPPSRGRQASGSPTTTDRVRGWMAAGEAHRQATDQAGRELA